MHTLDITNFIHECHYTGCASELKAAAYFLEQGYQVFMPTIQQGHIDFVILTEDGFKAVQVKTATWQKSGPNKYLQVRTQLTNKYKHLKPKDLYDILFCIKGNDAWIIPAESINSTNLSLQNTGRNKVQWGEFKIKLK